MKDTTYDETYSIRNMILYDSKDITLDIISFYFIGRLYKSSSIDTMEFILPCIITSILQSWGSSTSHLSNLVHSITPQEMKCDWGYSMYFLIFGICIPLLILIVGLHVKQSIKQQQQQQQQNISSTSSSSSSSSIQKLIEFLLTLIIFLFPYIGNQFFHLHHWYYGWMFGMHCNLGTYSRSYSGYSNSGYSRYSRYSNSNTGNGNGNGNGNGSSTRNGNSKSSCWWSRLCMSIFWGIYINGVSIFGRDPIMTCDITLYQSQNQLCPYITLVSKTTAAAATAAVVSKRDVDNKHNNNITSIIIDEIDYQDDDEEIEEYGYGYTCSMCYGNYTIDDLAYDSGFYNHIININNDADDSMGCN